MGGPCTVPCSLDCDKTFPWNATIGTIDRITHRRLFHGVNRKPHLLLRSVSFKFGYDHLFTEVPHMLAFSSFLALPSGCCLQISTYANLWRLHPFTSDHLPRIQIYWDVLFMKALFRSLWTCRCLSWDHVSSLAFENITLRSWPILMQDMTWLLLSSRNISRFQLVVVCSARNILSGYAVWDILWGRRVFFEFRRGIYIVFQSRFEREVHPVFKQNDVASLLR